MLFFNIMLTLFYAFITADIMNYGCAKKLIQQYIAIFIFVIHCIIWYGEVLANAQP